MQPFEGFPPFLRSLRDAIRLRHYSIRTEEAYVQWVKRFILFHGKRHTANMGEPELRAFLTHLAVDGQVAAATQNQALNALVFLYRNVVERPLGEFTGIVRAKRPPRLPVVLTPRRGRAHPAGFEGGPLADRLSAVRLGFAVAAAARQGGAMGSGRRDGVRAARWGQGGAMGSGRRDGVRAARWGQGGARGQACTVAYRVRRFSCCPICWVCSPLVLRTRSVASAVQAQSSLPDRNRSSPRWPDRGWRSSARIREAYREPLAACEHLSQPYRALWYG